MQEYWSGLSCPPPGYLPNPGMEPKSPTLQADSLLSRHQGNPKILEWVAYSFSRVSPALQVDSLPAELPGKPRSEYTQSIFRGSKTEDSFK